MRPRTSPTRRSQSKNARRKSVPSISRALVPYSRSPVVLKKEFPSKKVGKDNKVRDQVNGLILFSMVRCGVVGLPIPSCPKNLFLTSFLITGSYFKVGKHMCGATGKFDCVCFSTPLMGQEGW